ncbi:MULTISPECIES: RNA polymerase factor sigma-54 [Sphingopyxis]|uniref:RNA polymerase factor sigma-54 n=1 Tax=Sphingopyxis TaxID=165697 RepID=UPI00086879E8|nr:MULTISPECIES: RNA polymerase factor sigma-54 [Sphingopyxis]APW71591.1 RNA polymerase sigma-54 factor [Sphingopyxis granuli]AVA15540.1 RNA polymerase sigma-54 factor [Sphingopyxis sp. MG]ODU28138.1 MAG: RNA polymerase sigma-54 factor [Sphingopyxis sp. SCN 67-31]
MALGPRLDLRQSQSLVMTPQLQQAIKLLALSNLELEAYLAEALEGNPLLDTASADGDGAGDERGEEAGEAAPEAAGEGPDAEPTLASDAGSDLDVDFDERFHHDSASDSVGLSGSGEAVDFDSFAGAEGTLYDHLLAQVGERFDGIEAMVAEQIVALIDEAGYLRADLADLAQRLGVPLALVEAVLAGVQGFDPSGVGARDLAECVAIQAREADRYDPAMATMIAHLDLVAKGAFPQLKRICGVDDEDLADMIRELRGYDPKPGLRFGGGAAQAVVPDLFVQRTAQGWAVEVNSGTLPRLLVNRRYYSELARGAAAKSKAWLSEQLAGANWLVRALDQRQRTIVKVASEIVRQQEGFFLHGVAHMRPLTLRQVAEAIGMHESTVSRVTSNKYLSCARGLFELKYFFSSGIAATDGDGAVSAEAIKSRIRALIEAEDAKAILSDETIAQKLAAEGHAVARRTVVKYREAMGYGSSVQRRRQKALAG